MRARLSRLVVPASLCGIAQGCVAFAGVLGILTQISPAETLHNASAALISAIVIQLTCALCALFAGNRVAAIGGTWSLRMLLLIVIGAARGVAILLLLGPSGPLNSLASILLSIIFYAGWSIGIGLVVQGARDYRRAYAHCVRDAIDSATATRDFGTNSPARAWTEALQLAEAERQLALSLLDRQALLAGDPDLRSGLAQAARDIYQGIDERVRPTSHRLWAHARPEPPRIKPAAALLTALTRWQAPLIAATTTSALAVFLGAARLGLAAMVVLSAGTIVSLGGLLVVRSLVVGTGRTWDVLRATLFILMLPVGALVLDLLGSRVLALPPAPVNSVVVGLAAGVIAFTITTVRGVNARRMTLIDEVRAQVAEGAWSDFGQAMREARDSSEAGVFLHHQVQSHLLATAISLELAASDGQDPALELVQIRTRLEAGFPQRSDDPGEVRFTSITDDWAGICDVTVTIDPDILASTQEWARLDALAREAVASGVRRAGATWASIDVARADAGELLITFASDGQVQAGSSPGLGSAWARAHLQPSDERAIPGPAWQASIRA